MTHRIAPLRIALFSFTLFALSTGSLHAQGGSPPVVLSERVGPSLDSLEIVYFGLFPRIGAVRSASVGRDAGGRMRFEVDRVDRDDTVVTIDETTERALVRYVEEFERMETGDVPYVHDAGVPFRLESRLTLNRAVRVETVDGQIITGALLHVDDRGVIVLPGSDEYDWRRLRNDATALAGPSIERVVISGPVPAAVATGVATLGAGAAFFYVNADDRPTLLPLSMAIVFGGLFGGAATSLYSADQVIEGDHTRYLERREAIAAQRVFSGIEPPELRVYADEALPRAVAALPPSRPDRTFATMGVNRISVAINATAAASDAGSTYQLRDVLDGSVRTVRASLAGLGFGAEVAYDLTTWLDVGAGVNYRATNPATDRDIERVEELGGLLLAHVNLMPRRALGRSELELLVGAGVGYSRLATEGALLQTAGGGVAFGASIMKGSLSAQLRAQARFNFTDRLGLAIVGYGQWYPPLSVPEYSMQFPTTREELAVVEAHEIALSGLHMQVGVRYWF
ncbi:MAG TPA: hypothetical protein VNA88_10830 [Candidatus Kapabacteria bacterium]|nr:hypothetical protein [Candidatus Kapabacteria bacterium]